MRKTILAALLGTAILAGCAKETMLESTEQKTKTAQPISVDITVATPGDEADTKAAKTNWATGDRINIWYDSNWNQTAPDLVIKYDGNKWAVDATATVSGNTPSASGTLRALYLSDNSDLSGYTASGASSYMKFYPPAAADGLSRLLPMVVKSDSNAYTYSGSTLTSKLAGWEFKTTFKVIVKDPEGVLTSETSNYTLTVENMTQSTSATAYSMLGVFSDAIKLGTASTIKCAGAIRESDGLAFYFGDFSVASTDKVVFTFKDYNQLKKKNCTKTGKTLTTSSSACTGISMNYSSFSTVETTTLSASATANCYIVSKEGDYRFKTVKGNSSTSVGTVSSATVLWESFGTSTAPSEGQLIKDVIYSNGYITFTASDKKGNAVIAAKDASGNVLWSWHIWMTDQPADQVYNNNAGTMMDRNLGATSATKGDVKALGLMYQWGRKDPFLGSSAISSNTFAKSTITWPSAEDAADHVLNNTTLAYAIAHPTVFLKNGTYPTDWYATEKNYQNGELWSSTKTIYDPCPVGYRVPDGGTDGIWSKAFGSSVAWTHEENWDSTNRGIDFGSSDKTLGSGCIWYPDAGYIDGHYGTLALVGSTGQCFSCTSYGYDSNHFDFVKRVNPSGYGSRSYAKSVRCCKE